MALPLRRAISLVCTCARARIRAFLRARDCFRVCARLRLRVSIWPASEHSERKRRRCGSRPCSVHVRCECKSLSSGRRPCSTRDGQDVWLKADLGRPGPPRPIMGAAAAACEREPQVSVDFLATHVVVERAEASLHASYSAGAPVLAALLGTMKRPRRTHTHTHGTRTFPRVSGTDEDSLARPKANSRGLEGHKDLEQIRQRGISPPSIPEPTCAQRTEQHRVISIPEKSEHPCSSSAFACAFQIRRFPTLVCCLVSLSLQRCICPQYGEH